MLLGKYLLVAGWTQKITDGLVRGCSQQRLSDPESHGLQGKCPKPGMMGNTQVRAKEGLRWLGGFLA